MRPPFSLWGRPAFGSAVAGLVLVMALCTEATADEPVAASTEKPVASPEEPVSSPEKPVASPEEPVVAPPEEPVVASPEEPADSSPGEPAPAAAMAPADVPAVASTAEPAAVDVEERKSVLVMDLKYGEGISKDNAFVMTQEIATVMAKDKRLRVQTLEDARVTLGIEAQKQMAGCIEKSCMAEVGQAIGTDTLLFGRLDRIGSQVTFQLTLIESNNAQPLARLSAKDKDVASILGRLNTILVEAKNELNPPIETKVEAEPGLSSLFYGGLVGVGAGAVAVVVGAGVAGVALMGMADTTSAAETRNQTRLNFFFPFSAVAVIGVVVMAGAGVVAGAGLFE